MIFKTSPCSSWVTDRTHHVERSLGMVPPHFWLSAVTVYLTKVKYYQLGSSLCISNIIFCNALIESFIRLHQPQNLQVMFFLRSKERKQHLEMGCNCPNNGVSMACYCWKGRRNFWQQLGKVCLEFPDLTSLALNPHVLGDQQAAEALINGYHFLAPHSTG